MCSIICNTVSLFVELTFPEVDSFCKAFSACVHLHKVFTIKTDHWCIFSAIFLQLHKFQLSIFVFLQAGVHGS